MNSVIALALLLVILAAVAALLERANRRTAGLPRAPFGADADGDLLRVQHDLDVRRWA